MAKSIYYDIAGLLSQRCLLNFIIGNRGGGKTYGAKKLCINRFMRKGKNFVWIRRYQSEIDKIFSDKENDGDFWGSVKRDKDLKKKYPNLEYSYSGNKLLLDGQTAGTIVALSTSMQLKSIDWDNVTTVIFDEFLVDKGRISYLKNECHILLELMETIGRMRNDIVFILIGNAISIVNPYFTFFNITPNLNQRYTKSGEICIEFYWNEDFIAAKEKTKLGRLIAGTSYGEYNMRNKFLRDSDAFIDQRPPTADVKLYQFIFEGERFSLWQDVKYQRFYIDRAYESNFGEYRTYVSDLMDMDDNDKSMIVFKKNNALAKKLALLIERGDIYFCDQGAKQKFYEKILVNY